MFGQKWKPAWTLVLVSSFFLLYRVGVRYRQRVPRSLQVTFLDVGQGDSALISFPGGDQWLVDGGGAFLERGIGRELFAELSGQGILRLDAMVLSHPDADHGEGLLALLSELQFGRFFYNPTPKRLLNELIARARLRNSLPTPVALPQSQQHGGVRVALLPLQGKTTNDQALVLRLEYGGCSVLFTGDIEKDGEKELVRRADDWRPPTLLKVAHHGSRTSSTPDFLRHFPPRFAVVSTGVTNRYGHPNTTVLERLGQFGAQVLRTDFHGWIRFTFTAQSEFACESSVGRCGTGTCLPHRQKLTAF